MGLKPKKISAGEWDLLKRLSHEELLKVIELRYVHQKSGPKPGYKWDKTKRKEAARKAHQTRRENIQKAKDLQPSRLVDLNPYPLTYPNY